MLWSGLWSKLPRRALVWVAKLHGTCVFIHSHLTLTHAHTRMHTHSRMHMHTYIVYSHYLLRFARLTYIEFSCDQPFTAYMVVPKHFLPLPLTYTNIIRTYALKDFVLQFCHELSADFSTCPMLHASAYECMYSRSVAQPSHHPSSLAACHPSMHPASP